MGGRRNVDHHRQSSQPHQAVERRSEYILSRGASLEAGRRADSNSFPARQYVALESLEKTYKYCNVLSNFCVFASSECHRPIGIATLHEPNVRHFLAHLPRGPIAGIDPAKTSIHTLVHNTDVVAAVLAEALRVGKGAGLKGQDLLGGMILDDEEWLVSRFDSLWAISCEGRALMPLSCAPVGPLSPRLDS